MSLDLVLGRLSRHKDDETKKRESSSGDLKLVINQKDVTACLRC